MNILIVKTSAIGDVTHTMPALNCLRKHFPDAHITWLVEQAASDLILGHKSIDRVLVSKRKKWVNEFRNGAWFSSIKKFMHFAAQLRDRQYDLVIDFQGLLKSGIWVWLSRGRRRIGFGRGMHHSEYSYIFLNEKQPAVDMEVHALDRDLMLLKGIGVPCGEVVFNFPITDTNRNKIKEMLRLAGFSQKNGTPLVAINPQTHWETKLWYNDRFSMVADILAEKGCFIVFTGGVEDSEAIWNIQAEMKNKSCDFTGKTTLKELAALYEKVDVVISTDTGPMHIAASLGTPVVALFGPTAPWRTGPYGDRNSVLQSNISCSPCFKRHCPSVGDRKKCMRDISVDQVVDRTMGIIAHLKV